MKSSIVTPAKCAGVPKIFKLSPRMGSCFRETCTNVYVCKERENLKT